MSFHWPKHNQLEWESLRGLRICASACWWHCLKDCSVTQTGIITHFHASILSLWNVTPYSVSFRFAFAALSPFCCTWVSLTLLSHYLLLSIPPYLFSSPCPFIFHPLSLSSQYPHLVFLYLAFLSLSLCFTWFGLKWHLAQMTVVRTSYPSVLLVWFSLHLLKLAEVECAQTALLNWWCLQVTLFGVGPLKLK